MYSLLFPFERFAKTLIGIGRIIIINIIVKAIYPITCSYTGIPYTCVLLIAHNCCPMLNITIALSR